MCAAIEIERPYLVECPACKRPDIPTSMRFYVPEHTIPGTDTRCENSHKGAKPNHSKDGKMQLCFGCGKYVPRTARFCPRCES